MQHDCGSVCDCERRAAGHECIAEATAGQCIALNRRQCQPQHASVINVAHLPTSAASSPMSSAHFSLRSRSSAA